MQRDEFEKFFAVFDQTGDDHMEYAEFARVLIPATQKLQEAAK